MTDAPDWAIESALVPFRERHPSATWTPEMIRVTAKVRDASSGFCALVLAYAAMIAEHEQPPVDPLLIEAREIAAQAMKATFPDVSERVLDLIRSGDEGGYACVTAAYAALRRGIELARTKSEAGE